MATKNKPVTQTTTKSRKPSGKPAFRQSCPALPATPAPKAAPPKAAQVPDETRVKGTIQAPGKLATHTSKANDERRIKAATDLVRDARKDAEKSERAKLVARLSAGDVTPTEVGKVQLSALNGTELSSIARSLKWAGYSGLCKDELVAFLLAGGVKPAPKKDSTREMREKVSAAKKAGLVSGPISTLKVDGLKAVVKALDSNLPVPPIVKSAPNKGTMDYNKNLLRGGLAKGYSPEATAKCKAMFDGKSISTLKADQLKDLCKALGLV